MGTAGAGDQEMAAARGELMRPVGNSNQKGLLLKQALG